MIRFHLIDIDDLTPVKENHMNRLLGSLGKVPQEWFSFFSEIELAEKKITQFHQLETQEVVSRLRILTGIPEIGERGDETMGCTLGEFDFLG
jgi:hypothetical protein